MDNCFVTWMLAYFEEAIFMHGINDTIYGYGPGNWNCTQHVTYVYL